MTKRMNYLLVLSAAVALIYPAAASADATLQYSGGSTLVPYGSRITGTGKNIIITSSLLGEIKCEVLNTTSTVAENSTSFGWDLVGHEEKPVQEKCSNPNGAVVYNTITVQKLESTVEVGRARFNFSASVNVGSLVCHFYGTSVEGTYTNGGQVITFSKAAGLTSSPSGCGTVKLDGSFQLEEVFGLTAKAVKIVF